VQGYRDRLTSTSNPLVLAEVAESLTVLRTEYPEEYTLYGTATSTLLAATSTLLWGHASRILKL